MKNTKTKKGISLIVLVITIIVMIILAAAIILSLNNSGIIDKANKAKKDSDVANLKEYVNVLEAEWELMSEAERAGKTSTQYVNEKLEDKYPDAALAADGKVYSGLNTEARKAVAGGIQIGDTVTGYTLDSSKSSTKTSGKENTAPRGKEVDITTTDTKQTVNQTAYSAWRYIGIGDKGEILIAPEMPATGTVGSILLSGKGGYLNGPSELNSVCNALYSTDKGTARSMNIEDINRMLNYTPPEAKKLSALGITSGQTPDGSSIGEYYDDYYDISKESNEISATDEVKSFVYTNKNYWLASQCTSASTSGDSVLFYVRCVWEYMYGVTVMAQDLFNFNGNSNFNSRGIRPVVSLNSNLQLTRTSDRSWSI